MAIKDFCEELPLVYATWVQFWDAIVAEGLHKTHETVQVIHHHSQYEKLKDKPYLVQFIKDRAFEELLADRLTTEEVRYWTNAIGHELLKAGFREKSTLLQTLGTVKRILLTQSIK